MNLRAILAGLLLSACATPASDLPPPDRLQGCWSNRDVGVVSMRWTADAERAGVLRGIRIELRSVGPPDRARYSLEPAADGYSLCELNAEGANGRCWQVAQGAGGSLEGGRAFIDAHHDRLRITIVGDGPEREIFNGRRAGCG